MMNIEWEWGFGLAPIFCFKSPRITRIFMYKKAE